MAENGQKWEAKIKTPTWHKVKSMDPNTKRRNLIVKVKEVKAIDGKTFAEVVVGDESGIVTCRFYEDQLPLAKPGKTLRLQNAAVNMFQGHIRVVCDKWAKLAPHADLKGDIDTSNDISNTEYELISS